MHTDLSPALAYLDSQVLGKQHQIKLAVTCLLADGHLLIEDLPGMGKTTLSHALASFGHAPAHLPPEPPPRQPVSLSFFSQPNWVGRPVHGDLSTVPIWTQLIRQSRYGQWRPRYVV